MASLLEVAAGYLVGLLAGWLAGWLRVAWQARERAVEVIELPNLRQAAAAVAEADILQPRAHTDDELAAAKCHVSDAGIATAAVRCAIWCATERCAISRA